MIPASNAQHLMLRADVIEACAAGKFSIWPIETIDQGIALLTGHPVGERGADGSVSGQHGEPRRRRPAATVRQTPQGGEDPSRTRDNKTMSGFRRLVLELGHGAVDRRTCGRPPRSPGCWMPNCTRCSSRTRRCCMPARCRSPAKSVRCPINGVSWNPTAWRSTCAPPPSRREATGRSGRRDRRAAAVRGSPRRRRAACQ